MSDLVEKLRAGDDGYELAAADEIERLTAERDAARAMLAQYEQAPVVGWAITDGTTTDFARYKDEANEVASSIDAVIPLIARPEVTK